MMKQRTLLALSALLLALALPAHAEVRARRSPVEQALSAIEGVPRKADLERLGLGVDKVLQDIVAHPSKRVLARVRALTVLRYYPSKTTQTLLRQEIAATQKAKRGLPLIFLGQALRSYAVAVGPKAVAVVQPQLAHPSIDVRVAAAEALRLSRAPSASAILAARAKHDPSATVRAELQRQLRLLDGQRRQK